MDMPPPHDNIAEELFLADLRMQTSASHHALEENDISKALLSEQVSNADYRAYLVKMYGLIKGLELTVYPVAGSIFPDLSSRLKAHLLEDDLKKTGMSQEAISKIPVKEFTPVNEAAVAGIMYVLEGSTLGGRILYKHVNKHLSFSEKEGASFFHGYAQKTGSMWKEFLRRFTGYAAEQKKQQEVTDAAIQTFKDAGEWFSKPVT